MCMCGGVVEVGIAAAIFAWFKRRLNKERAEKAKMLSYLVPGERFKK